MNYTTIEQSKKLLDLGLNPSTADMWYHGHSSPWESGREYDNEPCPFYGIHPNWDYPCWSVGALLEIIWKSLPSVMLIPGNRFDIESQYWCTTDNEEICYDTDYYDSAIEALYDMICWLLQNDYIKTKQS